MGRQSVWGEDFPVHRAAMTGDVGRVSELIKAGYPAAEHDDDSWTPLHYAAWHGQAAVVRIFMQVKPMLQILLDTRVVQL